MYYHFCACVGLDFKNHLRQTHSLVKMYWVFFDNVDNYFKYQGKVPLKYGEMVEVGDILY